MPKLALTKGQQKYQIIQILGSLYQKYLIDSQVIISHFKNSALISFEPYGQGFYYMVLQMIRAIVKSCFIWFVQ